MEADTTCMYNYQEWDDVNNRLLSETWGHAGLHSPPAQEAENLLLGTSLMYTFPPWTLNQILSGTPRRAPELRHHPNYHLLNGFVNLQQYL